MIRRVPVRLFVLAAVLPAALAMSAGSEARPSPQLSQLLGFVDGKLVRVDSGSLQPLPRPAIPAGSGGCASRQGGTACWTVPPWTVSPDATRLAIARNGASSLRLVDTRRMRVTADVGLDGGAIGALAWLTPGRLLALQEAASERQRLVAVDLAAKRVAARRALGGSVVRLERTASELVLLLAPAQAVGPARIAVANPQGAVRFVRLERILAGSKLLGAVSEHRVDSRVPGLAIDPRGRRAFVVGTGVIAEVDLTRLIVSYHALPASLLDRAPSSFAPAAPVKQLSGYRRSAHWLGSGQLAVSGADTELGRSKPVGLLAVDTRSWNVRAVDTRAAAFVATADLLLVTGERTGVSAYGFDGDGRFQLFEGESVWLAQIHDGRAYVGMSGRQGPLQIVDLAAGRVVGDRKAPLPWLVKGDGSGWWE